MKSVFARTGALSAVFACAALLASCQSPAPPPAPPPPPPAPPAPPPIALSSSVAQAAAAYESYVKQASALTPNFTDGDQIQASLREGEAYEPKSMARDTVAYAAVLALQTPSFVQGVRAYAVDPKQREQMVSKIEADPSYAASFPGAAAAAALIAAKLGADGDAIAKAGYAIKESAYSIQHQKWSTEFVKDRDGRLALAKQISSVAGTAPAAEDQAMMQAALTGQGLDATAPATPPVKPPYTPGVNRGLAIAALAALGAAGDANDAQIEPLLNENVGEPCLNLAKLNLFQCLAVAKPNYEDMFCLGQHALMDTGECVSRTAGVVPASFTPPPEPKPAETEVKPSRHGRHHGRRGGHSSHHAHGEHHSAHSTHHKKKS